LDPAQIVEMRTLIRNLRGAHTILISSHILSEISQTCDRLIIIQDGEIAAQGTEEELAQRLGNGGFIELEIGGSGERALAAIKKVPGLEGASLEGERNGRAVIRVRAAEELQPQITRALVAAEVDLFRMARMTEKLESIFLKLTQKEAA
jgi:ABC-2 type transport system ATP-binding protein